HSRATNQRNGRGTVMGRLPFRAGEEVRDSPTAGGTGQADGTTGRRVGIAYRLLQRSARLVCGTSQTCHRRALTLDQSLPANASPARTPPWTVPCFSAAPRPAHLTPESWNACGARPPPPTGPPSRRRYAG